jgi:predicted acetyltransferase
LSFDLRIATPDDHEAIQRLVRHAFMTDLSAAPPDPERPTVPDERRLVAVDAAGQVVGHLGVWELGHWLGGRCVKTGGVSAVVVDPVWRGRGVGGALLRAGLDAMADRGEHLATLFALTRGVYRRLGWEVAGERPAWHLRTAALGSVPAARDVELVAATPGDVAAMAALEARLAPDTNGMLARGEAFARRSLVIDEGHAGFLVHREGELTGYVVLSHGRDEDEDALFSLQVRELVAADAASWTALLRLLGSHASGARTVALIGPPSPPWELLLPERALRADPGSWRWMSRAVDLAGVVAARGWPEQVETTVELLVTDPVLEANAGHWRLSVAAGTGRLERGGAGDVRLDVGAATSLLTGWADPAALRQAGRLEGDARAVAGLAAATAAPTPWVRDFF